MKALQPLPGLQFTCNTTSLAMMGETHAHHTSLLTPCEDECSPHCLSGYAQSLQLRSSSPVHRAPSSFDPFHARRDRPAHARSTRLFTPLDQSSLPRCHHQLSSLQCVSSYTGATDLPCALPRAPLVEVNTGTDAPVPTVDMINVLSCNTVATDFQNFFTVSPRSLQTPRSSCSRPTAPTSAEFQTMFSSPLARGQHPCKAAGGDRSLACTPTCKTPEQQPCQHRGLEDTRLHAPYRSSPLPLRVEGIRRFDCSNSSDEDDDDEEMHARQQRHSSHMIPNSAEYFGERPKPCHQLLPPPLLQRLSPPDRRSSDGGSSGAGRLVCNLVERFNNTQLYDALNISP